MTEERPRRKKEESTFVPSDPVTRRVEEQIRRTLGAFSCGVCGKPYATAADRDACEAEDNCAHAQTTGPTGRRTTAREPSTSMPLMVALELTDDAVRINTTMARFLAVARSHPRQTFLELLRELFDAAGGFKSHAYDLAHGRDPRLTPEAWRNWIRRLEARGVLVPRPPDR
ncbi:MAG: hypothetical protein HY341_02670 [Candidatus Kerfeldbacteria bacterium]|nr:hypothetical protein [Candidatus Kerfeldbacteria bacterium]